MSESRPKPALRVDTRTTGGSSSSDVAAAAALSALSGHSHVVSVVTSLSSSAPDPSKRLPDSSDCDVSVWWDGAAVDESSSTLLKRGRITITPKRWRGADTAADTPTVPTTAQPAQTLAVLIKTFTTKRPSVDEVQRLRYDFEAFQHLTFDTHTAGLRSAASSSGLQQTQPQQQADRLLLGTRQRQQSAALHRTAANVPPSAVTSSASASPAVSTDSFNSPIPFIKPLHLLHDETHGMALIYRDSGGRKLSSFVGSFLPQPPAQPSAFQLISFLHCALALTELLSAVHSAGVIYRSLRPSTTLYEPTSRVAQFLDFSQSSLLSSEKQPVDHLSFPEGSLPYTAPEATGRMNRSIDTRSDLYSLGCSLMELLTGRPPFVASDPMEIIHCHLAKHPPGLLSAPQLAAAHPAMRMINDIILKLLQKPAEDRYQSTAGLKADLVFALHVLSTDGATLHADALALAALRSSSSPSSSMSAPISYVVVADELSSSSSSSSSADSDSSTGVTAPATVPTTLRSLAAPYGAESFAIGRMDLNSVFRVSQKLYGRDEQVAVLLSAFDRVASTGAVELVLVSGYSGIGKTSLVDEVHKPIVREKGLFIRGKFDLYKRNVSCILEAFSGFVLQLLADDAASIDRWRRDISAALGANGAVVTEVIPELEKLIGPQPAVPKLPPDESQFRFDSTFTAFLSVLARKQHPMVLFTDDLQWADSKSLQLLRLMFTHDVRYLLLICAYRDNEVSPSHPFIRLVNNLKAASAAPSSDSATASSELGDTPRVHTILLQPLRLVDIAALVQDTVQCSAAEAAPLAQLLMQKTSANPFYLYMMLQSFYADALIRFDFSIGRWHWDLEQLRLTSSGQTSDVVELLCSQIARFTPQQQEMMKLAACLGNVFSLQTLATVAEESVQDTARQLWAVIKTGLVLSLGPSYQVFLLAAEGRELRAEDRDGQQAEADGKAEELQQLREPRGLLPTVAEGAGISPFASSPVASAAATAAGLNLRFMHDKVQAASYHLIPAEAVRATHVRIGRILLRSAPPAELEQRCFDIVEQLNYAAPDLLESPQEARALIRLNVTAGNKAKLSVAYEAAVKLLEVALSLVRRLQPPQDSAQGADEEKEQPAPPLASAKEEAKQPQPDGARVLPEEDPAGSDACWSLDYELTCTVYRELAEAVYLSNDYPRAIRLLSTALLHTETPLQRVALLEAQMQPFIQQHQMRPALDVGLEALRVLGVELVPEILLGEVTDAAPPIWNEAVLQGEQVMSSPTSLAAMRILISLCAPCYVLDGQLFGRVACTMVRISCEEGACPLTAVGLGLYCILLNGFRRLRSGWLVGKWALRVLHRFPATSRELTAKVYGCIYAHNWQYHRRLRDALPFLLDGVNVGTEAGDLEWSGYDTFYYTDTLFFASEPLDVVSRTQHDFLDALVRRKQLLQSTYLNIWRRLVLKLLMRAPESYSFHGKMTTDADILQHLQETTNHMFLFTFHLASTIHLFLLRRYEEAVQHAEEAAKHSGGVIGMVVNAVWSFYYSLSLLSSVALPPDSPALNLLSVPRPPPVPGHDFLPELLLPQPASAPASASLTSPTLSVSSPGSGASRSPQSPEEPFPYALSASTNSRDVEALLAKVVEQQQYLNQLAASCPANFLSLYLLVEAERTRLLVQVMGRVELVPYCVTNYDAAISTARQHGQVNVEAMAQESCAFFFMSIRRKHEARSYLRDAHFAYGRWGCTAKLQQMQTLYPHTLKIPIVTFSASHASAESSRAGAAEWAAECGSASSHSSAESSSTAADTPTALNRRAASMALLSPIANAEDGVLSPQAAGTPALEPAVSRLSTASTSRQMLSASAYTPPALIGSPTVVPNPRLASSVSGAGSADSSGGGGGGGSISLESLVLLKACATFSVETNLSKLLRKVMLLLIQHANASKGFLVLAHDEPAAAGGSEWRVEVQANIESDYQQDDAQQAAGGRVLQVPEAPLSHSTVRLPPVDDRAESPSRSSSRQSSCASSPEVASTGFSIEALAQGRHVSDCLPVSVFNLVVSTQATLLLSSAELQPSSTSPFARDPYFAVHHPRSLLCAPIKQQSKLMAVLYLENAFFDTAFSAAQLRVCEIVCIQAALSISNARLYAKLEESNAHLEQTVMERTAELEEKNEWLQAEIIERQTAQEAMKRAKEEADAANKGKSDFLSNMSHEIRTPMNAVLGLSRMLLDTELSAEQSQYLSMITSSGELLLSIINDILDWSKIDSQKLELESRSFSLLDCVENAVQLCSDMAGSKQLDLTYLVDPSCPPLVLGDVTRLCQITLNLLSNACKFTREGEVVVTVQARALGPALPAANSAFYQTFLAASPSQQMASPSPLQQSRRLSRSTAAAHSPPMLASRATLAPHSSSHSLSSSASVSSSTAPSLSSPLLPSGSSSPLTSKRSSQSPLQVSRISSPKAQTISSPSARAASPTLASSSAASSLSSSAPQRYKLYFAVRDTGIGIRDDVQRRLFNSFTQAESSTTRRFGGTGLGLAISKRLAEAMGGEMWLSSEEGKGSTFFFNIVATAAAEEKDKEKDAEVAAAPAPSPSDAASGSSSPGLHGLSAEEVAALRGKRVLIICRRPASCRMFVMLALSYGLQAVAALSVAEALDVLKRITDGREVQLATAVVLSPIHDKPAETAEQRSSAAPAAGGSAAAAVSSVSRHKQDVSLFLASLSLGHQAPASTLSSTPSLLPSSSTATSRADNAEAAVPVQSGTRIAAPTSTVASSAALLSAVDLVLLDCESGDQQSDDSLHSVEAALQQAKQQAVLCVLSTRRREEKRERSQSALTVSSSASPADHHDAASASRSVSASLPPLSQHAASLHPVLPSIQAHNLNLSSDLLKADERKQGSGTEPARCVTPLPPSPNDAGNNSVEVLLVMKPVKQRDLLRAVCSAFQTLQAAKEESEQRQQLRQAATQQAEESKAAQPDIAAAAADPAVSAVARPVSARGKLAAVSERVPVSKIARISDSVPLHILLAEDNKINQKMMSMLLGKLGYRIVIAENGREVIDIVSRGVGAAVLHEGGKRMSGRGKDGETAAPLSAAAVLELAGREAAMKDGATAATGGDRVPFDVILMDVSMEEMDGLECTAYLRHEYGSLWLQPALSSASSARPRRPYIIACTANASSEFQKKCYDVGMDDWVSKPVEIQQLVRALHAAHRALTGSSKTGGEERKDKQ